MAESLHVPERTGAVEAGEPRRPPVGPEAKKRQEGRQARARRDIAVRRHAHRRTPTAP
jgi:hypothetical protein